MIEQAIHDIDGVEFVANMDRDLIGGLLKEFMHTRYVIAGGVIYTVNRRHIIMPDKGDGYEVKISDRVNDFVTDGSSELFDILVFLEL